MGTWGWEEGTAKRTTSKLGDEHTGVKATSTERGFSTTSRLGARAAVPVEKPSGVPFSKPGKRVAALCQLRTTGSGCVCACAEDVEATCGLGSTLTSESCPDR